MAQIHNHIIYRGFWKGKNGFPRRKRRSRCHLIMPLKEAVGQKVEGSESGKAEKWLTEGQRGEQEQQDAAPAQRRTHRCVGRLVMSVWTRGRGRSSRRSSEREERSGGESVCVLESGRPTANWLARSQHAFSFTTQRATSIWGCARSRSSLPRLGMPWHHHVLSYLCLRIHHEIIPVEPRAQRWHETLVRYGRRQTFLRLQRPLLLMPFICTCGAWFSSKTWNFDVPPATAWLTFYASARIPRRLRADF